MASPEGVAGLRRPSAPVAASRREAVGERRAPSGTVLSGHPAALLTGATFVLVLLGLMMILSASSVSSFATYGSSFLFFKKQLIWAIVGIGAFLFFTRLDYRKLKGVGYVGFAASIALLLAVLVPGVGIVAGGSARWIGLGPLSFQPSEFAKLALILFVADVFSRKDETLLKQFSHTALPLLPGLGVMALLVLKQPDLGTTLMLGSIGLGMLFVSGAPLRFVAAVTGVGAVLATVAAFGSAYRRERIFAFLDPWADPLNTGYHTIQSLLAIASGGWFGVGLGASRQKWLYVPNAHTDFIFAILGEEMGLLGSLAVVGIFGFMTYLGIRIARSARDRFGMLVASGITIWFSVQALVNIGAVTAALPITGIPLPLVSFGGSSLVVLMIAMGVLTNIARQGRFGRRTPGAAAAR